MTGAVLMMVVNLVLFSAAQSSAWLVDIVFRKSHPADFVSPLACGCFFRRLASGLETHHCRHFGIGGCYAYASGFVVGFLLAPAVWWALGSCQPPRRRLLMGIWCLWVVLLTWLVLLGPAPGLGTLSGASAPETSMNGMARLALRCEYVLAVLGSGLGKGFPLDEPIICPIIGGLLILVLVGCLYVLWKRRAQPGLWCSSYPWLAFCAYGLANAAMICFGRMRNTLITALAPRYLMLSGFFVLSLVLLVAELRRRGAKKRISASSSVTAWPWGPVALSVLAFTLSINWFFGVNAMHWYHDLVLQNRAAMMFADVLPLPQSRFFQLDYRDGTTRLVRYLRDQHRLFGVKWVKSTRIADLRHRPALNPAWAGFDSLRSGEDSTLTARGRCALSHTFDELPDLVLITATPQGGEENIAAFVMPIEPPDFYAPTSDGRNYPEHYCGWEISLERSELPRLAQVTLRAYAFVGETGQVWPIKGEFQVNNAEENRQP